MISDSGNPFFPVQGQWTSSGYLGPVIFDDAPPFYKIVGAFPGVVEGTRTGSFMRVGGFPFAASDVYITIPSLSGINTNQSIEIIADGVSVITLTADRNDGITQLVSIPAVNTSLEVQFTLNDPEGNGGSFVEFSPSPRSIIEFIPQADLPTTIFAPNLSIEVMQNSTANSITPEVTANRARISPDNLTIITPPPNGTVTVGPTKFGYTPNAGFTGTDSFTYMATDSGVDSNVAIVTITVQMRLNCECSGEFPSDTLANIRSGVIAALGFIDPSLSAVRNTRKLSDLISDLSARLGFAGTGTTYAPGIKEQLTDLLNESQQLLFTRYALGHTGAIAPGLMVTDGDLTTMDYVPILSWATGLGKAHYGQGDAKIYFEQAERYLDNAAQRQPPNAVQFVTQQVIAAQKSLYYRYSIFRTSRWYSWQMHEGERFYDIDANNEAK